MERQEHLIWPESFSKIKNVLVNPSALRLGKDPDRSCVHPDDIKNLEKGANTIRFYRRD
jgi:hypothetical protein